MKKINIFLIIVAAVLIAGAKPSTALAYIIEDLNFSNEGDIVMGPGKIELWMSPGDSYQKELIISNRTGQVKIFNIEVQDFKASEDPSKPIEFLGDQKSPYSLKDYIRPETTEFTLNHGQRMRMYVSISIPADAEPGGLYGALLIGASNPPTGEEEKDKAQGAMKIITRLASLAFIRVKGDTLETGFLKDFKTLGNFYEQSPITLNMLYQNQGNVHLSPYGVIEIKNIFGKKIDEIQIDPWFILPDSARTRQIKWERGFLVGPYTATITLNRGYQDIIDKKTITFWVFPWKILLAGFAALLFIVWIFVRIISKFEIKMKPPKVT
jgi:hypothetical protein